MVLCLFLVCLGFCFNSFMFILVGLKWFFGLFFIPSFAEGDS